MNAEYERVHDAASRSSGLIPAAAGVGLRLQHHQYVLEESPSIPWLEVHTENYMHQGPALAELERLRADYGLSLHSVGLSLGSAEGLDASHVRRFNDLIERLEPSLISDHLSWSVAGGVYLPDLLPLPYTEEALLVVSRNIDQVQAAVKRRLLVENPSTYLQFATSDRTEHQFLAELVHRTGCGILLDVNNIYVSASNAGADPFASLQAYLRVLPSHCVQEIHLAGHAVKTFPQFSVRIDDHGSEVCKEVWSLYEMALAHLGPIATLIEWDTNIPAFEVLQSQARQAEQHLVRVGHRNRDAHGIAR